MSAAHYVTRACGCFVELRGRIVRACSDHVHLLPAKPVVDIHEVCTCRSADCSWCMKQPGPLRQPIPAHRIRYADQVEQ